MNRYLRRYFLYVILLAYGLFAQSCIKDDGRNGCGECLLETVVFTVDSPGQSKSSYQCSEDLITSFNLLVYSGNRLVSSKHFDEDPRGKAIEIKLAEGQYECYAVANVVDFDPDAYTTKDSLLGLMIETDGSSFDSHGFPMTYEGTISVREDRNVSINLRRVVSLWEFSVDMSAIPGLVVSSVRMMNTSASVCAFGDVGSEYHVKGDFASDSDIERLNSGGHILFYVPENLQGNLLDGNKDPYEKNHETLCGRVGEAVADRCTYLELTASFDPSANNGTPLFTGNITYRFYLGADDTGNFDVIRNTENKITFSPTLLSPEAKRPDGGPIIWKAEPDVVKHSYSYDFTLMLSKNLLTENGETFTATVLMQAYADDHQNGGQTDVSQWFTFSSDDSHISMNSNSGSLSAAIGEKGTAEIKAESPLGTCSAAISWDIPDDALDTDPVISTQSSYHVSLSTEDMGASRGGFTARIIAVTDTYRNGVLMESRTTDITDVVGYRSFTSDNPNVTIDVNGNGLVAMNVEQSGSATISATGTAPFSNEPIVIEPAVLKWADAAISFEYTYKLAVNDVTYNEAGSAVMTKRGTISGYIVQEARKYVNGTLVSGPYITNISSQVSGLTLSCMDSDVTIDYRYIDGSRFQIGRLETGSVSGQATIFATGMKDGAEIPILPGVLKWNFTR